MLLNEKSQELIKETYETYEHKGLDAVALQEWVESDKSDISEEILESVVKIAQNQEKYVNETNFSANIANFTPRLQPLLRRVAPKLMAFDICGVQPISMPTTDIFMIKAQYSGSADAIADKDTSVILEMVQGTVAQAVAKGDVLTSENGAKGTVVYVESDFSKAVVNVTAGTFISGEKVDVGATYAAGTNDITVSGVYSNEAGFKQILPGYSGPYTTAQGEVLGEAMRQLRVTIVKQGITAKTRKLKAELTLELIKDMKAIHGAAADKEVMFFLESEIVNDINMEIINEYKTIAVNLPNYAIVGDVSKAIDAKGRWSQEQYSALYDRVLKDCIDLSNRNRRGPASHMVATAGVITALTSLKLLSTVNVKAGANHSQNFVGTLPNGVKVYQDWFATTEYYMVIFKGNSSFDSGLIYSPYTMLELLEATNPVTFQPVLGMMTRYGLTKNLLTDNPSAIASDYCSIRMVDFTDTVLA